MITYRPINPYSVVAILRSRAVRRMTSFTQGNRALFGYDLAPHLVGCFQLIKIEGK